MKILLLIYLVSGIIAFAWANHSQKHGTLRGTDLPLTLTLILLIWFPLTIILTIWNMTIGSIISKWRV